MKKITKAMLFGIIPFSILTSCNENNVASNVCQNNLTLVCESENDRKNLSVGETNQIEAHVYGGSKDEVNYKSLTEEILSVSETGLVTALKKGSGKIEVSCKADETIKKVISYTVVEKISQAFSSIGEAKSDLESYEYDKGVTIPVSISMDLGKISGKLSSSSLEMELFDTSNTSTYGNLKLPINLSIYEYAENEEKKNMMDLSIQSKTFLNDICSRNILLSAADKISNIKGILYSSLLSIMNTSYDEYLDKNDYKDITSLNISCLNGTDFYSSINRDFTTSNTKEEHAFAFQQIDFTSLLLPIYKEFLKSKKEDKLENETSFDYSELLTKDGLLQLSSFLSNYIDEKKDDNSATLSLNETGMKFVESFYEEHVTESEYSYSNDDIEISFTLPKSITAMEVVISKEDDTHPTKNITFRINGKRKSTDEEYTFFSISMDKPVQKTDDSLSKRKDELVNYIKASENFTFEDEKTNVVSLIKESDILYQAETNYGATNNQNMKNKKDSLLSYYYSSFVSEERKRLLYPLYRRIQSLDLSYEDYVKCNLESTTFKDSDEAKSEALHLLAGESVNDFDYTLKSSDEEMFTIDQEQKKVVPIKSIYNGEVNSKNEKQCDSSASITFTITPKENVTTISSQTKSVSVKYEGTAKGFRNTKTTFKENSAFDSTTREYTIKAGATFDPSALIQLPSGAIATYASTDDSLAKKNGLLSNKFTTIEPTTEKDLVGIKVTVAYTEDSSLHTETVVFYLKITK